MILTLVTLLIWLAFTVIRSFTSEADAVVPVEIVLPLNPNLDTQTLDQMESKFYE